MKRTAKWVFLSFFIPCLITAVGYMIKGIAPFGGRSLMAIDGWGQYFPMLREARRMFRNGQSFSLSGGLGFSFTAESAYYTNSPLWWILFLMPGEITPAKVDLLIMLKIGLSGAAFSYWLLKKDAAVTREELSKRGESPAVIAFSSAYALSGYMLSFIHQLMWMDAVVCLPFLMLGIRKLVRAHQPFLYFFSLSAVIYSNFYIGYMVCVFSCLFFITEYFTWRYQHDEIAGKNVKGGMRAFLISAGLFAIFSLLSGVLSAPVLLPTLQVLRKAYDSGLSFKGPVRFYGNIGGFLLRFLPFTGPSLVKDYPNVYCGLTALLLIPLAFHGNKRRLLPWTLLSLFLLFSLRLNLTEYFWHGFHFPNQLPMRESFLLIALLLTAAYEGFGRVWQSNRRAAFLLAFLLFSECTANALVAFSSSVGTTFVDSSLLAYEDELSDLETELDAFREEEPAFYRTELQPARYNGGMLYGFESMSHYSSMMSYGEYCFFTRLGSDIYAKNKSFKYRESPVLNTLLGVRYLLYHEAQPHSAFLNLVETADDRKSGKEDLFVYENTALLPLAYMVDGRVLGLNQDQERTAYELQNALFLFAAGESEDHCVIDAEGQVNTGLFYSCFQKLQEGAIRLEKAEKRKGGYLFEGTVRAKAGGRLLLSLAYGNCEVYVDGERAETEALLGLMTITGPLPEGEHRVRITAGNERLALFSGSR